ncbi:MAG: hypothetical protein WCK47_02520 [bacterium]|nr:hypothetical protein [Candidatus Sumerlaeota bacterium]
MELAGCAVLLSCPALTARLLSYFVPAAFIVLLSAPLCAEQMVVQPPYPPGYVFRSLELGQPYGGTMAQDSQAADRLYVAVGSFGNMSILAINKSTGTTVTVAGPFGNIGGLASLSNGDLAIAENFTSDTILRARDFNSDGDFLDTGEISELINPIMTDGDFTGAQMAVAPSSNASGIPGGALMLQSADGNTSSELLVIVNPESSPSYRPPGGAYFAGFQYNGGFAFDNTGNVIIGESRFIWAPYSLSGRIMALVNKNHDDIIGTGEWHTLVDESRMPEGLADLAVSRENVVFFGDSSGVVKTFTLPSDLLTETAVPVPFLHTNAVYVSTVRFDQPAQTFTAGPTGQVSRLYAGGLSPLYAGFTNLIIVEPENTGMTSAQDWVSYE